MAPKQASVEDKPIRESLAAKVSAGQIAKTHIAEPK